MWNNSKIFFYKILLISLDRNREISTCTGEFVGRVATGHQPLAPVDGLPIVDGFAGVKQDVQQLV